MDRFTASIIIVATLKIFAISANTIYIEESSNKTIDCSQGNQRILIINAEYGERRRRLTVTKMLREKCNNKARCQVSANNLEMGDGDPAPGKLKNLKIEFICKPTLKAGSMTTIGIEGQSSAVLRCSVGDSSIVVTSAYYGYGIDFNGGTYLVKQWCDGLQKCMVPAENSYFGNPYNGMTKTVRVKFYCQS